MYKLVSKSDVHKSLPDVLRLDMDADSQAIIKSSTNRDVDSKQMHILVNLMEREIHGFQDQLASFAANNEKL